jgi:streptomycin 6-kinase
MRDLERTAHTLAREWGVELGERFALAHYSFVAAAGEDAVLKVVAPEDNEADHELDALLLWGGDGAVRVLRHDRARKAMLLERARPGHDLTSLPEEQANAVAVEVAQKLWRPVEPGMPFRSIADHVPRWLENVAWTGHELVPVARAVLASLEIRETTLIHGDFHHHNVLRDGERWLAIDAKAMIGEPEFDVPPYLWNPSTPTPEELAGRIAAFAAAGLDPERIRRWAILRGIYQCLPDEHFFPLEVVRQLL